MYDTSLGFVRLVLLAKNIDRFHPGFSMVE